MGHVGTTIVFHHDSRSAGHTDALCHALGGGIGVAYDGAQPVGPQLPESIRFASLGGFRGVALVPMVAAEQVSHLYHLSFQPILPCQSALPYQFARIFPDGGPQSVSVGVVPLELPFNPRADVAVCERSVIGLHRLLVLHDEANGFEIFGRHFAKVHPFCFQNDFVHGFFRVGVVLSGAKL